MACVSRVSATFSCLYSAQGPYSNQVSTATYNGAQNFMCIIGILNYFKIYILFYQMKHTQFPVTFFYKIFNQQSVF
jgi:hypothetical protein